MRKLVSLVVGLVIVLLTACVPERTSTLGESANGIGTVPPA